MSTRAGIKEVAGSPRKAGEKMEGVEVQHLRELFLFMVKLQPHSFHGYHSVSSADSDLSFSKVLLSLRLSHLIWQQYIPQSSLSHLFLRCGSLVHVSSVCHCVVDKTGKKNNYRVVEEGLLPPS